MASIGTNDCAEITQLAGAAVTENRFCKVGASAGLVIHATAHGDNVLGTIRKSTASGDACTVILRNKPGTFMVEASAAIVAGALVTATTAGKAVTASSTNLVHAVALTAAAADGDLIKCVWASRVAP